MVTSNSIRYAVKAVVIKYKACEDIIFYTAKVLGVKQLLAAI